MCRHVVPRICGSLELSATDKHEVYYGTRSVCSSWTRGSGPDNSPRRRLRPSRRGHLPRAAWHRERSERTWIDRDVVMNFQVSGRDQYATACAVPCRLVTV